MTHLTDQQLLSAIETLVGREREILNDVLLHLREIDRRKLFSTLSFTSLFDYATKQLKYSPDQAGRRIAAMRVLREVPDAQAKVIDGSLTLSALAQAHWHFNKVAHSTVEKKEILAKLENATKKQTRAILKQEDKVRYNFEASETEEAVIEKLRGLNPHLSFSELMIKVCKMALEQIDPAKKIERAGARAEKKAAADESADAQKFTSAGKVATANSRYVPAEIKREVWKRGQGKCQNCSSTYALEYDHIIPFAKGGASTQQNLRLLCRSCNQRKGIEHYGAAKMSRHLEGQQMF